MGLNGAVDSFFKKGSDKLKGNAPTDHAGNADLLMDRRCCDDFTRSKLLRQAAAEAGRGLPAIEQGMP